ncbi:MAG: glycosyltransferase family 2 protein [Planctomycetaceae bacterium]|nr:glycosyltransferase family 2 protein [Planctomycetaceae bacterium]
MSRRVLTALPVFNEDRHIPDVLPEVIRYSDDVLVVDDGSRDGTPNVLRTFPQVHSIRHERNQGYGAALRTAFAYAVEQNYDALVTIDCDGQHEPGLIPTLVDRLFANDGGPKAIDLVSGSRYLKPFPRDSAPPADRRRINLRITALLNECLGLQLTDSFCGFKAYRVSSLSAFDVTELGYAMPLQHWVQAVAAGLEIAEFPVPLVYLEEERSFGGSLDDAERRMRYYLEVLGRELCEHHLPLPAEVRELAPCC